MTKDSDLRRKMQEAEAARDAEWDRAHAASAEIDNHSQSREFDDRQQRIALACDLLRSGQSGPEVERLLISTMLTTGEPATQSVCDTAAGIVDMARFSMGATLPSGWTPFDDGHDPRPRPDHPEQEDDDDV